ncbi:MAG: diguanylate cyclase [Magnetococcales bacterium]|nr:diguanylate cyclase [Magnetococcales bacterium]
MESMETFLERILKGLERDPPGIAEAKRLLKEMLVRQPWVASVKDAQAVGALILDTLVKPLLAHDRERGAEVERLGRQLRSATQPVAAAAVAPTVTQIAGWIKEIVPNPSGRESGPPDSFRERLVIVLRQLGEKDPRLSEAIGKLTVPSGSGVSWKDLHTLLSGIVIQEDLGRSVWQQEREALKKTLLATATALGGRLQALGHGDAGEIEQALERLRGGDRLTDLEELNKLLQLEAEAFEKRAQAMREQVEEGRQMLVRVRDRLHKMEEALHASQDEQLIDAVSGLPNRFSFSAHLTRNMEQALKQQEPFALMLCRLEGLGGVLEKIPEKEGRRLTLALAKRLREKVESEVYIARLSTEMFACILPGGGNWQVMGVATRIHELCEALRFRMGSQTLGVRPAFGAVIQNAAWNEQAMLLQADTALAMALSGKQTGVRLELIDYQPSATPPRPVG